jgi:hypothetical protein
MIRNRLSSFKAESTPNVEKPGFYSVFFCPSLRVYHTYHASAMTMNNAPPMTKMFMLPPV